MENAISVLQSRLDAKREQYKKAEEYFKFTATQEHGSSDYERNAIGDLASMLKLSAEIGELEFVLSILHASEKR